MQGPERIDYQETADVTEVHASIQREHSDPRADVTPIPVWLTVVCGIAICWAGAYLGVFHGGFSPNVYNEYESNPGILFPIPVKKGQGDDQAVVLSLAQQGKAVYAQCAPCHQPNGQGLAGVNPPLVQTDWVIGGEKRLLAILLKGLTGPITINGAPFVSSAQMPGWASTLTDRKIAAVASYVRSEWGNAAPEIIEADVAAARKEFESLPSPVTEAILLQIPADANYEGGGAPAATAAPAASTAAPAGAAAAGSQATPAQLAEGKKNYMMVCVACHQPTGLGLPPVFPPLAKTEYVNGSAERFAAMILKGNAGPMTIDGKAYNNLMPGLETTLSDDKIASIMTFVRASFGNNAPPVGAEVVAAARKKYADRKTPWTEPELKAFDAAGGNAAAPAPAAGAPAAPAPSQPAAATPSSPAAPSETAAPTAPAAAPQTPPAAQPAPTQ